MWVALLVTGGLLYVAVLAVVVALCRAARQGDAAVALVTHDRAVRFGRETRPAPETTKPR